MVDTLITIFPSNAIDFSTNGLGSLKDAISCVVTEERNGIFELVLKYPVTGEKYSYFTDDDMRKIIYVKPNPHDGKQPFRIYDISTPLNGVITINAAHISYDLSGFLVKPFTGTKTLQETLDYFRNGSVVLPSMHNFTFTNNTSSAESSFSLKKPATIRSLLGGEEGSLLDLFKCEFEFDKFNVILHSNRGQNKGVSIRYGKNLTDLDHDKACDGMYTGVYPYFYRENQNDDGSFKSVTSIEGAIQYIPNYGPQSEFRKIYPLDCTSDDRFKDVPEEPSQEKIDEVKTAMETDAIKFITDNEIGKPKVSIDVSFVALEQSEEYEQYKDLYTVRLCDTVNVYYPKLNINATEKCIKTNYDVIAGKYESIELGEGRSNLVDQVASQNAAISDTAQATSQMSQDFVSKMIAVTNLILNNKGGILEFEYDANNHPTTMKIYVTNDGGTKTGDYWIFNSSGLGFYKDGQGYMNVALDKNGRVIATNVEAGTINGSVITGGSISGTQLRTKGGIEIWNTYDERDPRGYVDFHSWGSGSSDYTSRIYEQSNGALVVYNTISDASDKRLKKDIVPLHSVYNKLLDVLNPCEYRFIKGDTYLNLGFIAQDVREALDKIGITDKPLVTGTEEEGYLALAYNQFIPILWSIVKDLKDRVEYLENQNKEDFNE